ncbi:MAG: hypothetical protein H7Y14_10290 [Burkholderiales bacterium]|nr:hypothetical protein [Burkholderiales bacterium]
MRYAAIILALALAGCASTSYELTVMPRNSGKLYTGSAEDAGNGEGRISITIEGKAYSGTWVETQPSTATGYVMGGSIGWGWGWGRGGRGMGSLGSFITMDNPQGSESKALLTAPDGSGLRCDFKSGQGRGGGVCKDDQGREYDVQVRKASK